MALKSKKIWYLFNLWLLEEFQLYLLSTNLKLVNIISCQFNLSKIFLNGYDSQYEIIFYSKPKEY